MSSKYSTGVEDVEQLQEKLPEVKKGFTLRIVDETYPQRRDSKEAKGVLKNFLKI